VTPSAAARGAAELVGTALLVALGTGTVVGAARIGGIPWSLMALAWTIAVLVPILLFVRVSGSHLNPAVTLALAASGRIAWRETPLYLGSQLVGAFIGSGVVLATLGHGAHLGANVPGPGDVARSFVGEFAFTALLVASVFVLADRGEGRGRWRLVLPPAVVGLATFVLGQWTGTCSLNPARTLAPAVLSGTFLDLWVYLVAVPLGSLAVAVLWKPRSVDLEDRGPGRSSAAR
jgi:glycerol uptake facilitator-like aquaporin